VAVVRDSVASRDLPAFDTNSELSFSARVNDIVAATQASPRHADVERHRLGSRSLTFNDTPLVEVAEVFNRYSPQRLVIEDAQLRGLGISACIPPPNLTLIDFLRNLLRVDEQGQRIVVSRRR
jgi:ferric-dicitrate binding protein FerR (iron transport regulator)